MFELSLSKEECKTLEIALGNYRSTLEGRVENITTLHPYREIVLQEMAVCDELLSQLDAHTLTPEDHAFH